ncbi:MAG: nucleotidyltransferase [Actinomycetota bacterium]
MTATLLDSLAAIHSVLQAAKVPHALCGGLAANLYRREVRATSDVDFAVIIDPRRVAEVVDALDAKGWKADEGWKRAEQLRVSHRGFPRVDCIIATTDYEKAAVERAQVATIERNKVRVLTPEDLIVFKLVAGRPRDYDAVAAIINDHLVDLDANYIKRWLRQFGIEDTWNRALQEARRESEI